MSVGRNSRQAQSGLIVKSGGMLSLIQDLGRLGKSNIGITQGGPADLHAFKWCNRLLDNPVNASQVEITLGGLKLTSTLTTRICVTGAHVPLFINGKLQSLWQVHLINAGDEIELGYAQNGTRSYLGICGGFDITPQFYSCSTVVREGIGGLNGTALVEGDLLPAKPSEINTRLAVSRRHIPNYQPHSLTLRFVAGYQFSWFSDDEIDTFVTSDYKVSKQWDRMGYRLSGAPIRCDKVDMLSEGVVYGAIQIPADGQPIVLLNDRQTIGGYPKLGSVLSVDAAKLAQCGQSAIIRFEIITASQARSLLQETEQAFQSTQPLPLF